MQWRNLDLLDIASQVEISREDLAFIRNYCAKEYFSRCFKYAVEMASLIDIVLSMPRVAARQRQREIAESDTYFNYYRKNICLKLLDHLINGNDVRLNKYGKTVLMVHVLIPSVIAEWNVTIDDIVEICKDDLPASNNCQEEYFRLKRSWSARGISERPLTIVQVLKHSDSDAYLNLSVHLKMAGTVAITSYECERSGSALRCLNTYLRASVRQERLSGIALMHINYDVEISVDRVMLIFVKKPRALKFSNICSK